MAEKELLQERERKLSAIIQAGIYPYGGCFDRSVLAREVADDIGDVRLAGRVVTMRNHGKAAFADLEDLSGRIQVYLQQDLLGSGFDLYQLLDIGDIIGISGEPFRTRTGQLTVKVKELSLLSKSTSILPIFPSFCNSRISKSEPSKPSVCPNIAPITSGFSKAPSAEKFACIMYLIDTGLIFAMLFY